MFKVNNFDVCPVTGKVDIEYFYDLGHRSGIGHYTIGNAELANKHIEGARRDYISLRYESWVLHKKTLSERGSRDFYNTMGRLKSLRKCMLGIPYFAVKPLKEICRVLPMMEIEMRNILPSPNNDTYLSSYDALGEMLYFCKENS